MNTESPALPLSLPKLLVSVRDAEEVWAALEGGADWIDLKEPHVGALGAVEVQVAREAVKVVAGRRPLSAALGELCDWQESAAKELLAVTGVSLVKLGLAGCARLGDWQQQWQAVALEAAQADKQLVVVIYADWQQVAAPSPAELIEMARSTGSHYLLIDTYDKSSGSVLNHLSSREIESIFLAAKKLGMTTVLAGSVTHDLLSKIPQHDVMDIVAVRGAVCRGNRTTEVDVGLVENFRHALADQFDKCQLS